MADFNRWAEYDAGTLTPTVVVQHDTLYAGTPKEEHLVWVYAATGIRGPWSFPTYDDTTTLTKIIDILTEEEERANAEEATA